MPPKWIKTKNADDSSTQGREPPTCPQLSTPHDTIERELEVAACKVAWDQKRLMAAQQHAEENAAPIGVRKAKSDAKANQGILDAKGMWSNTAASGGSRHKKPAVNVPHDNDHEGQEATAVNAAHDNDDEAEAEEAHTSTTDTNIVAEKEANDDEDEHSSGEEDVKGGEVFPVKAKATKIQKKIQEQLAVAEPQVMGTSKVTGLFRPVLIL
ncbi:hypothetical protein K488DRAFT_74773 [Vararia minispora EC-137]|uniref:Uncharacterized protein n=1 Tax=Vararia minispora EC-137 TaxID=1314806 RepID=A0ACB8Q6M5_9AGAM|nr:hypothetical protein K488DRAFT_74773 [Vararia minispora EC-137]